MMVTIEGPIRMSANDIGGTTALPVRLGESMVVMGRGSDYQYFDGQPSTLQVDFIYANLSGCGYEDHGQKFGCSYALIT